MKKLSPGHYSAILLDIRRLIDSARQWVAVAVNAELTADYGKGWSERQLRYCLSIAEIFADEKILHTLCSELSWSHLRLIVTIDDPLKRDFYEEVA